MPAGRPENAPHLPLTHLQRGPVPPQRVQVQRHAIYVPLHLWRPERLHRALPKHQPLQPLQRAQHYRLCVRLVRRQRQLIAHAQLLPALLARHDLRAGGVAGSGQGRGPDASRSDCAALQCMAQAVAGRHPPHLPLLDVPHIHEHEAGRLLALLGGQRRCAPGSNPVVFAKDVHKSDSGGVKVRLQAARKQPLAAPLRWTQLISRSRQSPPASPSACAQGPHSRSCFRWTAGKSLDPKTVGYHPATP